MTALVERLVQKWTEAAPIEAVVSTLVAGVLENTAARLTRGEPLTEDDLEVETAEQA